MRVLGILCLLFVALSAADESSCEADGETDQQTCVDQRPAVSTECGRKGVCGGLDSNLYGHGGSAQAYKPDVPFSQSVCDDEVAKKYKFKVASWPLSRRSSKKGSSPKLNFRLNLHSCHVSANSAEDCCCKPMTTIESGSLADIWQTRPDGTYSSLRASSASKKTSVDECRGRILAEHVDNRVIFQFSTVSPGSTGILSGLGPSGFDSSPYGPPVIHMLFSVADHAPLLVDIPILSHPTTLEQRNFTLPTFDWRGVSWVRSQPITSESSPLRITDWKEDVSSNQIHIEADVFLSVTAKEDEDESSADENGLCPSRMYGLPGSFFLEPISVCFPSMLDFFIL